MDEFRIDFAKINLLELRNLAISTRDIYDLFKEENSEIIVTEERLYIIAYVRQVKFIFAYYDVSKNVNFDVTVLEITIPNEKEITQYWCKKRRAN